MKLITMLVTGSNPLETDMVSNILDIEKSEQYDLSIRLRPDGFSFYISNGALQDPVIEMTHVTFNGEESYLEQFKSSVYSNENLLLPYKIVTVVVDTNRYTLVPNSIYDIDKTRALLGLGIPIDTSKDVNENYIPQLDSCMLFEIDAELSAFLTRAFVLPNIKSHISALLSLYFGLKTADATAKMFVYLSSKHAEIVMFDQDSIQLIKRVSIENCNDLAFYILSLWQQFACDQENDSIYIFGDAELSSELILILKRYIRKVVTKSLPDQLSASIGVKHTPLDILTLSLCE
ncbi:MAG: DUF3822 family protein [Bacteroidales bacterium]